MTASGLNLKQLRTGLYQFVYDSVQAPSEDEVIVIWRDQNAPQPVPPYITLKLISGPIKIGSRDSLTWDEDVQKFFVNGVRTFVLSVSAFSTDSMEILMRLQSALELPENLEKLSDLGIGINNSPSITDITAIREIGFEQRSIMDIGFQATMTLESDSEYIEKLELSGDYQSDQSIHQIDETIEPI